MEYLTNIQISKNPTDRLKKLAGKTIEFLPGLNFIVGDNGIGKSGILSNIGDTQRNKKDIKIQVATCGSNLKFFYFDSERMNPRISGSVSSSFDVHSRFMSHGECLDKVLRHFKELTKSKSYSYLLLIDEPEGGLSPWKQQELLEMYVKHSKKIQIIIATHSMIFTQANVGRLIELTETSINYFDPPATYDWRGI
jgi:predicted ATPase